MQLPKLKKEKEASLIALRSQDPSGQVRPCKPFSPETFLQVLISFVVADDQVRCAVFSIFLLLILFQSINVMECPEFRNLLLLLQPDLASLTALSYTNQLSKLGRHGLNPSRRISRYILLSSHPSILTGSQSLYSDGASIVTKPINMGYLI